jgi:hypothetical protein
VKIKWAIICTSGTLIALGLFLYHDHWNSKPMRSQRSNDELFEREIERFRSASPGHDAATAVSNGDFQFYIVRRPSAMSVPGITNGYSLQWIYQTEHHKVIYYVSDVLSTGTEQKFQQAARDYVTSYNLAVERLIQTNITSAQPVK